MSVDPAWPPPRPEWRHDAPDPADALAVPWRTGDGVLAIVWFVIAQIVVVVPLVAFGVQPDEGIGILVALFVAQMLTCVAVVAWLRWRGRLSWRLLGPARPAWRHAVAGFGVGVAGLIVVVALLAIANAVFGPLDPPDQLPLERGREGGAVLVLSVLVVVVGAPVVEELIFRGLLFQSMRQRLGLFPAMVLSSFAWGLLHLFGSPVFVVAIVLLGVWLAGAFHKTGSLVVPIVAHAVFNAIVLAISFADPETVAAAGRVLGTG